MTLQHPLVSKASSTPSDTNVQSGNSLGAKWGMTKPLFITGFSSWEAITHSTVKKALLTPIFQDLYIKVMCQDFWVLMWFKTHFLMPARGREKANRAKALWHLRETPHWPRKSPECAYPPTQLLQDGHLLKPWVLVGQPLDQHIFGQLEYFTRVFICLTLWASERSHKTTKLLLLLLLLCVNPTMLSRMKVMKPASSPTSTHFLGPAPCPGLWWPAGEQDHSPQGGNIPGVLSLTLSECKGKQGKQSTLLAQPIIPHSEYFPQVHKMNEDEDILQHTKLVSVINHTI